MRFIVGRLLVLNISPCRAGGFHGDHAATALRAEVEGGHGGVDHGGGEKRDVGAQVHRDVALRHDVRHQPGA